MRTPSTFTTRFPIDRRTDDAAAAVSAVELTWVVEPSESASSCESAMTLRLDAVGQEDLTLTDDEEALAYAQATEAFHQAYETAAEMDLIERDGDTFTLRLLVWDAVREDWDAVAAPLTLQDLARLCGCDGLAEGTIAVRITATQQASAPIVSGERAGRNLGTL